MRPYAYRIVALNPVPGQKESSRAMRTAKNHSNPQPVQQLDDRRKVLDRTFFHTLVKAAHRKLLKVV